MSKKDKARKPLKMLKGKISFKAAKDKSLPYYKAPGVIEKITSSKAVLVDMDSISYDSKNLICKAYSNDDLIIMDKSKGGK